MQVEPVVVVGMGIHGREGLDQKTIALLLSMDELWGAERLLAEWPEQRAKTILPGHGLLKKIETLKERGGKKVAILASGDPGFHGIANTVLRFLPADEVIILPHVSSLQAAFAKAKLPWQDATLTSVHARPMRELIGLARRHAKLGILTDPKQNPAAIAETLLAMGIPDCRAIVCENLGMPEEKIIDSRLSQLPGGTFAPLNVLILQADAGFQSHAVGRTRSDDAYAVKKGMITKRDARLISLDRLQIEEDDILWDIGACSGAVSIEASERAWCGKVYAIERDKSVLPFLYENVKNHGAGYHVEVIEGEAPSVLENLPHPNAVFIGGSGGYLEALFEHIQALPIRNCRVVANFTVIENLSRAIQYLRRGGYDLEVVQADLAYGRKIGNGTRFEPNNPVYILSVTLEGSLSDDS